MGEDKKVLKGLSKRDTGEEAAACLCSSLSTKQQSKLQIWRAKLSGSSRNLPASFSQNSLMSLIALTPRERISRKERTTEFQQSCRDMFLLLLSYKIIRGSKQRGRRPINLARTRRGDNEEISLLFLWNEYYVCLRIFSCSSSSCFWILCFPSNFKTWNRGTKNKGPAWKQTKRD